jgi:hypothetical protein
MQDISDAFRGALGHFGSSPQHHGDVGLESSTKVWLDSMALTEKIVTTLESTRSQAFVDLNGRLFKCAEHLGMDGRNSHRAVEFENREAHNLGTSGTISAHCLCPCSDV